MNELYITAFLMGLLGGVHCLGMCGAVAGILTANLSPEVRQKPGKAVSYQFVYNFGRVFTYILMGVIFASFSYILASQIGMGVFEKFMRIFAAVMMIFIGLFIAGFSNKIQIIEKLGQKLWAKIQPKTQKYLPIKNYRHAFVFGLLWGNIPCGLVYAALVLTLTASPIEGGLIMLFFGLGTMPSMLAVGGFGFALTRFIKDNLVQKIAGILVIIMGVVSLAMPIMHMMKTGHNQHNSQQMHQTHKHQIQH
jgi:sulfite exporter TauE/SafE